MQDMNLPIQVLQDSIIRESSLKAPNLFTDYHAQYLELYDSLLEYSIVNRDFIGECFDNPDYCLSLDFSVEMSNRYPDLVSKINTNINTTSHTIDLINEEISDRMPNNSNQLVDYFDFSISYQPPVVPIKISLNKDGELSLSSESSIPTPIGVFSLGTEITAKDTRVLKIVSNNSVICL